MQEIGGVAGPAYWFIVVPGVVILYVGMLWILSKLKIAAQLGAALWMEYLPLIMAVSVIVSVQIGCTWWLGRELRSKPSAEDVIAAVGQECMRELQATDPRTAFFIQTPQPSLQACFALH